MAKKAKARRHKHPFNQSLTEDPLWQMLEEFKASEEFERIRGHADHPALPDTRESMLCVMFQHGWDARSLVKDEPTKDRCPPGQCQYTKHHGSYCGKCGRKYNEHDLRALVERLRNALDHYAGKYGYSHQTGILLNQALFALNRTELADARRRTRRGASSPERTSGNE